MILNMLLVMMLEMLVKLEHIIRSAVVLGGCVVCDGGDMDCFEKAQ